ncbi:putative mitochondral 37S ribosomal protein S27 [Sodiomyces alkalinus F11]|uniref:Small ribosomal subunit protein mS33 n=1 Tax=Sodiomyces alkalinus (strain CBS 110278 / VKM F-3762 / F11) TaxID=1314773 RepID=A0A3N2Q9V9_SODAK|nr:putative mitochondral 37S ribosomal protein S27 [Sodiomyces alkalinus F11]ROT43526.1 putative mitochondral 37S ribosomal protein S27 [Sodiomyces alkalinus F11]
MSVPRARLLDLMKAQCQVFATTYNPDGIRMGNKILRQRLRGPALAAYYPPKTATLQDVLNEFGPELTTFDEKEEDRLEHIVDPWQERAEEEEGSKARPEEEIDEEDDHLCTLRTPVPLMPC